MIDEELTKKEKKELMKAIKYVEGQKPQTNNPQLKKDKTDSSNEDYLETRNRTEEGNKSEQMSVLVDNQVGGAPTLSDKGECFNESSFHKASVCPNGEDCEIWFYKEDVKEKIGDFMKEVKEKHIAFLEKILRGKRANFREVIDTLALKHFGNKLIEQIKEVEK